MSFPFWKESKNTSSTEGLKRSNTAARQALHEVSKHVEQVKQYFGTSASLSSLSPPIYEYMAYTAVQMLPDETCLQIISCDESLFKEAQNAILLMPTEERARYLHECVASVPPFPECDYREIGYPAKFALFYQQEDGTILSTIRRGIFSLNTLLSNSVLYSELQGEDGFTSQKYKETVAMQDTAHVKKLQKDIGAVLKENPVWNSHLSYLPCYYVLVRNPGDTRLYFGALAEKGPALTFSQLMKKYYHGSLAALLETMTWGGRDKRDSYLVEELGAQYQSYRFDILHGTATAFFTLQDAKWRPCGPVALPVLFQIYAEKNQSLVREILETIKPHDRGTFFRMPSCKPIKTFDNRPEMDYCQDSSLEIHSALNTGSLCRAGQLTGGTISCRLQLT